MSDDDARGIAFLVLDPYTVLLPVEITTVESASLVEVRGRFTLPSGDTDEIMMAPPARPIVADDTIGRIIAVVRRVAGREIKVNGEFVTDYA